MTEDDTFRLLKRTPYSEVRRLIYKAEYNVLMGIGRTSVTKSSHILAANGWTRDEYDNTTRDENPLLHAYLDSIKDLKRLD